VLHRLAYWTCGSTDATSKFERVEDRAEEFSRMQALGADVMNALVAALFMPIDFPVS